MCTLHHGLRQCHDKSVAKCKWRVSGIIERNNVVFKTMLTQQTNNLVWTRNFESTRVVKKTTATTTMCIMKSLKYFFEFGTWARTQGVRLTYPPSCALGYCVELNIIDPTTHFHTK
jgi:hypothetical protein